MSKDIQKRVAETLLQQKTRLQIGGQEFKVAPPTLATIVKVSGLVAQLPEVSDKEKEFTTLCEPKDIETVAEIICTLVLGVKKTDLGFWQIFSKRRKSKLKNWVMEHATPRELCLVVTQIVGCLQINDFFLFTTSLKGIMMTRPTRKVVN